MSVKPLLAPVSVDTLATSARQHQPETIRVPLGAGEHLSLKQFLQRAVMIALGTADVKRADEFLRQSGLERHVLPAPEKSGEHASLPFKADAKFWKSIENFKQTGTALPLAEVRQQPAAELPDSRLKTGGKAARPIAAQARTAIRRELPPSVRSGAVNDGASRGGVQVSPESARQGKDGGLYYVKVDPNEFVDAGTGRTKVIDKDERKEVLTRAVGIAAKELKYSPETIVKYLETFDDTNSVVYNGNPQTAEGLRKNLLESAKAGKLHDFYLSSNARSQLYRIEIDLHGSEQEKLQVKVEDELTKIDEKYAALKPDNDLQKAALALARDNEKKAAIDFLVGQASDVRGGQSWQENLTNQAVDFLEKAARFSVDNHPLYRFLPEEAKKQIVDFQIGIGRGTVGLVGAVKGVGDFFQDAATDALLYSAKETGVDKTLGIDVDKIQANLKEQRGEDAKLWSNLANASTERIAKNQLAYDIKKDAGINLTIYDTPNWAVKGGEITAQAVPFIAVGVATGGASIPASVAIAAGTGAFVAGGTTYSQSRQYEPALKAAVIGAAQGAVIPLSGALGRMAGGVGGELFADAAANTAFVYTVGKLQGRNDAEIGQDIVLQLAQGGAFRIGGGLHKAMQQRAGKTLATEAAVQSEFQKLQQQPEFMQAVKRTVAESAGKQTENFVRQTEIETVAKSLEQQRAATTQKPARKPTAVNARIAERAAEGVTARARIKTQASEIVGGWGKNNKIFTGEQYSRARTELLQNTKLYSGIPADQIAPLAKIAGHHLEAGGRAFVDFVKLVKAETATGNINLDEADYQKLYKDASTEYIVRVRETLSEPARAEFDAARVKASGDEAFIKSLPKEELNIQKRFESITQKKSGQPEVNAKLLAAEEAARAVANRPEFLNSSEIKTALTKKNDLLKAVQSEVGVELAKQQLLKQFPPEKGYEVLSGVKVFEDTGFSTKADWLAANPGKTLEGYQLKNNRVMREVTDIDLLIVRKSADGAAAEIVRLEQIKAGENDTGAKAGKQMLSSVNAVRGADAGGEKIMLEINGADVTSRINLKTVDTAEQVTRGPEGKTGFDESVGVSAAIMKDIAQKIIDKTNAK